MNKNHLILIFFFLSFNCIIFPQENIKEFKGAVKIDYAKINFEGMITTYKPGITWVYPPSKVPVQKRYYKCTFNIVLSGDDFIIRGPLHIKCLLSNGKTIRWTLNPDLGYFKSNENYNFSFDLYSEESLFGRADLELVKSGPGSYKRGEEIVFDKTTIFVQ